MYAFHESAWHERGQGTLRINEKVLCEGSEQKEIRLGRLCFFLLYVGYVFLYFMKSQLKYFPTGFQY